MGEIAEAMLSGLFCAACGEVFADVLDDDFEEPGHPRYCPGCEPPEIRAAMAPPKRRSPRPIPPLRKQDRKWLEHIELLCRPGDGAAFVGGMYAGMQEDRLPGGPTHRLKKRGAILLERPHNPVHKARWVITDAGRAELAATEGKA